MNKMVWMISNNWILKCSFWCWMLGGLFLQCELELLLMSIYSCLCLVTHHFSHHLRDCLYSRWMYQYGTLLTLLLKALLILFWVSLSFRLISFTLYCHYHLTLFTLSVVCCRIACCLLYCASMVALTAVALVVSVVAIASL